MRSFVRSFVRSPVLAVEARCYVSGLHLGVQLNRHGNLGVERRVNSDDAVAKVCDLEKTDRFYFIQLINQRFFTICITPLAACVCSATPLLRQEEARVSHSVTHNCY